MLKDLLEPERVKLIYTWLQKFTFRIDLKKFLWLKSFKILCHGHVINDVIGKEIFGTSYEKEPQKAN